jgi:hypothetical protein
MEVNLHAFQSSAIEKVEILSSCPGILLFLFLSVFIFYTLFLSLSLSHFLSSVPIYFQASLVLLSHCFCYPFPLYFSFFCFFSISSYLSLFWSFTFCVLVMTSAVTLSLKSSDTSFQSCRDHCLSWSMPYVIFFSPPFNASLRLLPLPSKSFLVHYLSLYHSNYTTFDKTSVVKYPTT